ncbi:MAG: DUF72 domain-containing protein [Telluria sp.]
MDRASPPLPRVGCAGWSLSRHDRPHFPEAGSHLQRYAAVFNAAEINSSFYRPHQRGTYERWAESVPETFRFSVKAPKTVTHEKRLVGSDEELARFAGEAQGLGARLGWILVQLPPKFDFDGACAREFFGRLRGHFACGIALEARHATWFGDEATALLIREGVTRVVADPPACEPHAHTATTGDYYIRLHGSPRMYYSSYPDAYLAQMAAAMNTHVRGGHEAWCVFDNTAGQQAVPNALTLLRNLRA